LPSRTTRSSHRSSSLTTRSRRSTRSSHLTRHLAAVTVVAAAFAAGCSGSEGAAEADANSRDAAPPSTLDAAPATTTTTTTPHDPAFPAAQWSTVDAATAGLDPTALAAIAADAQAAGSNCFLVARDGQLVTEQYWNGTTPQSAQEVYSVSKSVTSLLAGIARGDGDLRLEDPAATYLTEWVGTPSEGVTVRNLLSNDSGRQHDRATDYVEMAVTAEDKSAFSIALGQDAPPGTTWVYNNAAIQTLEEVLSRATGSDVADFAQQRLFAPLGMADSSIRRDRAGNPLTFMGVQSTCRDLARLGVLVLHDGAWNGTTVVDADWIAESTGGSSQQLNTAYGLLWWLNRPGNVVGAGQATGDVEGASSQMAPGAPEDMVWALGLGNQVLAIDPGSGVVVVRLGPSPMPATETTFNMASAARVVTEALVPAPDPATATPPG